MDEKEKIAMKANMIADRLNCEYHFNPEFMTYDFYYGDAYVSVPENDILDKSMYVEGSYNLMSQEMKTANYKGVYKILTRKVREIDSFLNIDLHYYNTSLDCLTIECDQLNCRKDFKYAECQDITCYDIIIELMRESMIHYPIEYYRYIGR